MTLTVDETNKVLKDWQGRALVARHSLEMKAKHKALGNDWVVTGDTVSAGHILLADEVMQFLARRCEYLRLAVRNIETILAAGEAEGGVHAALEYIKEVNARAT